MLVEAAFSAAKIPGPLRAFFERVRARRGTQIAIVATARKLAVPVLDDDRARRGLRVRPPVADRQETPRARAARRDALPPRTEGQAPRNYSLKEVRRRELELAEQAEHAYRQQVADWQAKAPASKMGVAAANGTRLLGPQMGQAARQDQSQNLLFARGSTTPTREPNPD